MAKDDWKKNKHRVSAWLSMEAKARLDAIQTDTGMSVAEVFEGFLMAQQVVPVDDATSPETGSADLEALKARLDDYDERLAALEAVLVAQEVGPVVEDTRPVTAATSDTIGDTTRGEGNADPDAQSEPTFRRTTKRPPRTKPLTDEEKRQLILACAVIAVEQGSHLLKTPEELWDKLGPSEWRMMTKNTFKAKVEGTNLNRLIHQAIRDLDEATKAKRLFTEDSVRLGIEAGQRI